MDWTNPLPKGKEKASGATNPIRVTCSKCRKTQYARPGKGFECGSCKHRNTAR